MPKLNDQKTDVLRRSYSMRAEDLAGDGPGGGRGIACALGRLDSYRSVISPRAFGKAVLSGFVQSGFISDGHDWTEDLATIDSARVQNNELVVEWTWYPTDDAQEMRAKVATRVERGKDVGLSVGMWIDWSKCAEFDSGEKLWTYAEGLGEPMDLYDPAIRKHKGYCWIIPTVTRLVETAITLIPSVPGSAVSDVRALDDLPEGRPRGDLPFAEELDLVLGAVQAVEGRALEIEEMRSEQNGRIGRDNLKRIEALRDSLSAILARSISQSVPEPDPMLAKLESIRAQRRLGAISG